MSLNADQLPVLSVSELTNAIKKNLETGFPSVWLQGEISNFKPHTSGHLYFSLKDKDAQISAVMFRGHTAGVRPLPKDGDQVRVHGSLNVYPPSGKYQIVVDSMKPVGVGELLLKLEELKQKLFQKGYFKKEHKKPLPKFPKVIGVVTSPTGAAIQDILNILKRRFSGFNLLLNPVKVQGEGAAEEIAQAIRQFNELNLVDVMIVGRGGGSIEDLWAFNEEIVAEAIFQSKIPIVCAVGHETDHCIAEYVADVRAPTPSAAAEIVMGEKELLVEKLQKSQKEIDQILNNLIRQEKRHLDARLRHPILQNPYLILAPSIQKLDMAKTKLDQLMAQKLSERRLLLEGQKKRIAALNPVVQVLQFKERLKQFEIRINDAQKQLLKSKQEHLKKLGEKLALIDPKNLLKKGYAILFSYDRVIKSFHEVKVGDPLKAIVADGEIAARVEGVSP